MPPLQQIAQLRSGSLHATADVAHIGDIGHANAPPQMKTVFGFGCISMAGCTRFSWYANSSASALWTFPSSMRSCREAKKVNVKARHTATGCTAAGTRGVMKWPPSTFAQRDKDAGGHHNLHRGGETQTMNQDAVLGRHTLQLAGSMCFTHLAKWRAVQELHGLECALARVEDSFDANAPFEVILQLFFQLHAHFEDQT